MALNKTCNSSSTERYSEENSVKVSNCLVVRIDHDSDDNMQALFDSVLNPGESKRPLQVPFRMRKLPNSFFNPPSVTAKNTISSTHSRANSADSAFESDGAATTKRPTALLLDSDSSIKISVSHARAHSSPASLQQSQKSHGVDSSDCIQESKELASGNHRSQNITSITPQDGNYMSLGAVTSNSVLHMKQRSFDVVSPIQLQSELGALPSGWEQAKTTDGQIYYLNHITKTTQWEDPRLELKQKPVPTTFHSNVNTRNMPKNINGDTLGPLPDGWEQAFTESGDLYFINHINRTTSWNDPRIPDFIQKSLKTSKSDMYWLKFRQLEKYQENMQYKVDQNILTRHSIGIQLDPFLSSDNHTRQESSDSGLSLSSNTFTLNSDFISKIDDSMDCINENNTVHPINGLDCTESLVSSLQIEDNLCSEILNDVSGILNTSPKMENLDWYKLN